jgi:uncharacterized protein YggU (UPF0235/DUF167 family)
MPTWRAGTDHILLRVRLTPKAAEDRIDGPTRLSDGTTVLAARVRAVPESGRANDSLKKLIASKLGIPRSRVEVTAGHRGRLKQIRVEGDPDALLALTERLWPRSSDAVEGDD